VDAPSEAPTDLLRHSHREGQYALGQGVDACRVLVHVDEQLGHPAEVVHPLEEREADAHHHVLVARDGELVLDGAVAVRVMGVGPRDAVEGGRVERVQVVALGLAHVVDAFGGRLPDNAPLVGVRRRRLPALAGEQPDAVGVVDAKRWEADGDALR